MLRVWAVYINFRIQQPCLFFLLSAPIHGNAFKIRYDLPVAYPYGLGNDHLRNENRKKMKIN